MPDVPIQCFLVSDDCCFHSHAPCFENEAHWNHAECIRYSYWFDDNGDWRNHASFHTIQIAIPYHKHNWNYNFDKRGILSGSEQTLNLYINPFTVK